MAIKKYDQIAEETRNSARKAGVLQSSFMGLFFFFMFGFFLYSYYAGSLLIKDERINPATDEVYSAVEIISVSQATMMSFMTFGSVFPVVPAIIKALIVGKKVFDVIERKPLIASPSDSQPKASTISIQNGIKFQNVNFRYPTAPEGSKSVF